MSVNPLKMQSNRFKVKDVKELYQLFERVDITNRETVQITEHSDGTVSFCSSGVIVGIKPHEEFDNDEYYENEIYEFVKAIQGIIEKGESVVILGASFNGPDKTYIEYHDISADKYKYFVRFPDTF